MKRSMMEVASTAAALALLTGGCGEGGGTSAGGTSTVAPAPTPSPTPSPTPTPTPSATAPISEIAGIFENPTLTSGFFVTGGGWVSDSSTDLLALTAVDGDNFGFAWDPAAGGYRIDSADFGRGLILRVSDYFASQFGGPFTYGSTYAAHVSEPVAETSYRYMTVMETRRQDNPYEYVTALDPAVKIDRADKSRRLSWVWIGAAQPTPPGAVGGSGKVRYSGDFAATMVGNSGDQLAGKATLDFDFASNTVTGFVDVSLACFMGCTYPSIRFAIDGGTIDRPKGEIGAIIRSVRDGEISGRFAGPAGEEALLRVTLTYRDPQRDRDVDAMGVMVLRRE